MTVDDPDDPTPAFPVPPRTIVDDEGRDIHFRRGTVDDRDALVEMYRDFHSEDRAQGIPPAREAQIREWLETVAERDRRTVLASHEGDLVGHGMLVADDESAYELALFVLRAYQGAGIGTELLRTLLGLGQDTGVERVWLSVERWNDPAIAVYEKVGFERVDSGSFEIEMALSLH
jgi:RimJ/RimL family protein N-acetyltransferase